VTDRGPLTLRGIARAIRYTPDRLLHPLRRRAARKRAREWGGDRLVVLCHGNICRSPFAAVILRRQLQGEVRRPGVEYLAVESRGFILPGRPPPPYALEVAAARGLDLSAHRSRLIDEGLLDGSELLLVMEARQRIELRSMFSSFDGPILLLGDLDPGRIRRRAILDPIDRPRADFECVFDRIQACCRELVDCLVVATS
jgi:protein-tyrosine phosphatase